MGKSTNLSKICFFLLQNKYRVLIAAGDTFRSGAVEQLAVHVRNLKELTAREGGQVELYQKGYGKDAAAVAKDAVTYATAEDFDVVLIDTAGRRHNDQRLMSSLEKFAKFAQPDKILMVGEVCAPLSVVSRPLLSKLYACVCVRTSADPLASRRSSDPTRSPRRATSTPPSAPSARSTASSSQSATPSATWSAPLSASCTPPTCPSCLSASDSTTRICATSPSSGPSRSCSTATDVLLLYLYSVSSPPALLVPPAPSIIGLVARLHAFAFLPGGSPSPSSDTERATKRDPSPSGLDGWLRSTSCILYVQVRRLHDKAATCLQ